MLVQFHENWIESFRGWHGQEWVWPLLWRDFKIDYLKNEQMEETDFLHVDTDSQKLKAN